MSHNAKRVLVVVLGCALLLAVAATQTRAELIARYDLDEGLGTSVSPASGYSGNTGTINGNVSWVNEGPPSTYPESGTTVSPSNHLLFPGGSSKYIGFGDHDSYTPNKITVAFWAKARDTSTDHGGEILLSKFENRFDGNDLHDYEFGFGSSANGGKLSVRMWNTTADNYASPGSAGGGAADPFTATDFKDGEWHHIVGTFSGSNVCLYVDGGLIESVSYSGTLKNSTAGLTMGRRLYYPEGGSCGVYYGRTGGPLLIYDEALSASDVAALIPEPSTFVLAAIGLLIGLGLYARRRWRS